MTVPTPITIINTAPLFFSRDVLTLFAVVAVIPDIVELARCAASAQLGQSKLYALIGTDGQFSVANHDRLRRTLQWPV
jgi:hypothetical protein